MDIYGLAKANDSDVAERFEHASRADDAGWMAALSDRVEKTSRFSVNMRPHVAAALLNGDAYQNIYNVAARYSAITGRHRDEELRHLLGKYNDKRLCFDKELGVPETVYYAAVNIGGVGCSLYGELCAIVSGTVAADEEAVILKTDSLINYISDNLIIDYDRLTKDLASTFNVGKLVALKHQDDKRTASPTTWELMVCNDNDFTEAYVNKPLMANDLEEIRISQKHHDALMDLAFFSPSGPPRGAAERALVADFVSIKETVAKLGITLEVLEDPAP